MKKIYKYGTGHEVPEGSTLCIKGEVGKECVSYPEAEEFFATYK